MSIQAGVGRGKASEARQAGSEACQKAIDQLGSAPNLVIVYSSATYNQEEMLAGVKSVAGDAPLMGCSSAGEITAEGPDKVSVVVMALSSDQIKFIPGMGQGVGADSFAAGKAAAEEILKNASEKPSLVITFLEGLTGNGAAIVRGFQESLGVSFPLIGGSASDDFAFKKTFQYYKGDVLSDAAVGLGLAGRFSWGASVLHGWDPIGLPMKVTKSEGAVIKELDGQPALKIYEDYFGKQAEELIKEPLGRMAYTYPLGMSVEGSDELLIRNVVIANEKGEITCGAEIPEGSEVRLMLGDPEKAIESARQAAKNALSQLKGSAPKAILVFDCVARHKLLAGRIPEEIKAVQEILGQDVPLIGFYTYGEQAPLGSKITPETRSAFHNEAMALLVLGE